MFEDVQYNVRMTVCKANTLNSVFCAFKLGLEMIILFHNFCYLNIQFLVKVYDYILGSLLFVFPVGGAVDLFSL